MVAFSPLTGYIPAIRHATLRLADQ